MLVAILLHLPMQFWMSFLLLLLQDCIKLAAFIIVNVTQVFGCQFQHSSE
ncbi:hypothetical protein ECMP0210175_4859 [Escherichia coli MP021017.5]|nr:hypothetical protein ECMP0210176_4973 [Escherichia coli MP021017.6]EMU75334.1 hypothetical protein ECMP0210179_3437 [Escherichia coli MP021017.9]EMU75865.1 hypothetical protein ECMP0210175_4859 [Escherichia coli MP021017.5]EMU86540.1 hypothetical protein ECMP0210174_4883 [Escherichia coli MP021017.4]EMU88278.1 hypothetical protein ECMP0210173_4956 [Escherichia coli MP021017.3]EMU89980.1 hypothetical protein ECMP0210172_4911 [Escherichia coli MP021017.2]EMV03301.1 hypothetical protein ECMP0